MNPDLLKEHALGDDAEGNAMTLDEVFETDEESMSGSHKTRAHNLCHDNRQLIVIAINRNHSASKINCN